MYLWAIYDKWHLGQFDSSEMSQFHKEIARLLDHKSVLYPCDLDNLWSLYYATGDMKYPNRVKIVAEKTSPADTTTQAAAKWSYNSHVEQGLLSMEKVVSVD